MLTVPAYVGKSVRHNFTALKVRGLNRYNNIYFFLRIIET